MKERSSKRKRSQHEPETINIASDFSYWDTRARRAQKLAEMQSDNYLRVHYLKIAAGYTTLARRARSETAS